MSDLIRRSDAMGAVQDHFNADGFKGYNDGQQMMDRIKSLPSAEAEQVTGKLKNPCDSLLISDSDECKERKSKLDLISRQNAVRWVKTECNPYGKPTLDFESGKKVIEHLEQMPSAEPKTGEWIRDDDYICDQCGYHMIVGGGAYNFCPHCGAMMEDGDE